ncbi:MAG TPA: 3-phosphoshikimate 1-carboxyvinyltransferase [Candidatus Deferrimicrobiaceae bacterium]|nr:3-phosphoshikimate 1-carboxyvinyltransferase [Candidatus Deferrimicrobiaceae bacterium]
MAATTPARDVAATIPTHLTVEPATRLAGDLRLPGDKSISHRALMLALLAPGESTIRGAGDGADVRSTASIVARLGATVERPARNDDGNVDYRVRSPGPDALDPPRTALDCGNSGTSLRLFAGILAGQPFQATLDGDASLRRRPMTRVTEPLAAMGAMIGGPGGGARPPLTVRGRRPLDAIDWATPIPSAQVKSAILLAALRADGTTRVREAVATRDHTERMLRARGVEIRATADGRGTVVEIEGGATPAALDQVVPGDASAAAFWLVAGAIHPDARIALSGVGVNPTRRAVIDLLRRMGAAIEETSVGEAGARDAGEPQADLVVRSSDLEAIEVSAAETAAAIDEIAILCLAATQARGRSTIRGAGELRHKESDRIAGLTAGLRAFGAKVQNQGDDLIVEGPVRLRGATVDSLDDHRLAMTFAVAGLAAVGPTTVRGAASAAISYPAFLRDLERIRR